MEINELVALQRAYYDSFATRGYEFRINALKKLKSAIKANEKDILCALGADLNKSEFEGYMTEIGMVYDELSCHIRHLRKWMKNKPQKTPIAQFPSKSFIMSEPYGVVLIMSPWNYPFQLAIEPLIGAISSGNCAVVKPSIYAKNTSAALKKLISETFEEKYIALVEGGREANSALLDQKFDYIFFTGSVNVGKVVMERAAKNLTPVTLELGGKSPVVVDAAANLRLAAKRIAFGKFLNAGQTCVAPDYVLCDQSIKSEFLILLKEETEKLYPVGYESSFPTIISDKHFERVISLIDCETPFFGGERDKARRFIAPTVLDKATATSPVMQEEIFGPVLPVLGYESLDEAIAFINSKNKPLALYVFSCDKRAVEKVLKKTSSGGGCVNDTIIHLATTHMGFGGVGASGMGSYHGKHSYDTFSHYRSIVSKSTKIDLPMRYAPYSESTEKLIRHIMK